MSHIKSGKKFMTHNNLNVLKAFEMRPVLGRFFTNFQRPHITGCRKGKKVDGICPKSQL